MMSSQKKYFFPKITREQSLLILQGHPYQNTHVFYMYTTFVVALACLLFVVQI